MEVGRRAGRAVIGNYRVVAHGGSRERSRKRANKNASTLASDVRRSFSGGEFIEITTDSFAIIRNNSLRTHEKNCESREKNPRRRIAEREISRSNLFADRLPHSDTTADERNKHARVSAPSENGGRPIFRV